MQAEKTELSIKNELLLGYLHGIRQRTHSRAGPGVTSAPSLAAVLVGIGDECCVGARSFDRGRRSGGSKQALDHQYEA
jgi:hypothetical protein